MREGLSLEQIKGLTLTQINALTGSFDELEIGRRENDFVSSLIAAQGDKKAISDMQADFKKSRQKLRD